VGVGSGELVCLGELMTFWVLTVLVLLVAFVWTLWVLCAARMAGREVGLWDEIGRPLALGWSLAACAISGLWLLTEGGSC